MNTVMSPGECRDCQPVSFSYRALRHVDFSSGPATKVPKLTPVSIQLDFVTKLIELRAS